MKTIIITFPHAIIDYEIKTDSEELITLLNVYFYVDKSNKNVICNKKTIYLDAILQDNKLIHRENNSIIATYHNLTESSSLFLHINSIIRDTLEFEDEWNPYHGSAVNIGERTYILLGHTRSGKSTLSTFLDSKSDLCVIAEDIVILNFKTKEIAPFNKPFVLRQGGYDVLINQYGIELKGATPIEFPFETKIYCPPKNIPVNKRFYATASVVLSLDRIPIRIDQITSPGKYLMHSYLHNTMTKNIRSSVFLDKALPMYDMKYIDMNEVYDVIKTQFQILENVHE